ncbi:ATP-binding protein [Streptomyces sp. NPDC051133]|uniref:ATP-binding protein n=1 Tax=Streptomyces sp. NPDC051133 TaxID=3155521 RepID=UPI00341E0845
MGDTLVADTTLVEGYALAESEPLAEDEPLVEDETLVEVISGRAEIWIEGDHASLSHARTACRLLVASVCWSPEAQEDLILVVSELVTNACRYSSGPCRMNVEVSGNEAAVEVWDGEPSMPTLPGPIDSSSCDAAPACSGYGLGIVGSLSKSLEFLPQETGGKIVRAVVLP